MVMNETTELESNVDDVNTALDCKVDTLGVAETTLVDITV